tara:strand:- start:13266 stop:15158 length:1893 start_codon:yes stop_codon:yes gene_type:complete
MIAPSRAEAIERLTHAGEGGVLRFVTCGSVDDGKSTLIGRLLHDSQLLFEDQITTLTEESIRHGKAGGGIDYALLLDGLEAEREQGITIDVAYRFFATAKRKFIVADTPGHAQYTRNMATGASTADAAILLVDARKGLREQTHRHAFIVHMMGVRHIVLAINKMDSANWSKDVFDRLTDEFSEIARSLDFASVTAIPISAREGDNVSRASTHMDWYSGPVLLDHLETLPAGQDRASGPFRMPVQWVNRPDQDFRGFSGTIVSGTIAPGDALVVAGSGAPATLSRIVTADGDIESAQAGDAVTLVLDRETDIARGDVLSGAKDRPEVTDQFAANLLWMGEDPLMPGRSYLLKSGTATIPASVSGLKHRVDINTYQPVPATKLELNEIGVCNLSLAKPIATDAYEDIRETGSFILIDRYTNQTVGAGMIEFGLRRAQNIHRQAFDVTKAHRAALKTQKPTLLWFTGLSGAGKSTVANLVEQKLARAGHHTYTLDGDNVRHGLNRDLGFTDADRVENIRRIGEVGKLFVDAGLIVTTAFISPFRSERQGVRDLLEPGEFLEVFVDAPIEVCIQRDPKGLYEKAKAGEIKNFTGFDSPYEAPERPDIHLLTADLTPEDAADQVIAALRELGRLD